MIKEKRHFSVCHLKVALIKLRKESKLFTEYT